MDDALGYVYYAEEDKGIHKWLADPDRAGADRELALFATTGLSRRSRRSRHLHASPTGPASSSAPTSAPARASSTSTGVRVSPAGPHDHTRELGAFTGGADSTDGLDVVSAGLGAGFPEGLLVAMNSAPRNFLIFDWRAITSAVPALRHTPAPRRPGSR